MRYNKTGRLIKIRRCFTKRLEKEHKLEQRTQRSDERLGEQTWGGGGGTSLLLGSRMTRAERILGLMKE